MSRVMSRYRRTVAAYGIATIETLGRPRPLSNCVQAPEWALLEVNRQTWRH